MKKIIYCFWTGENEMSDNRKECLNSIKETTQCEVLCLFKDDIPNYILPEHPLHEGYKYLSETHKSDYLRTYFMNFYGGGYTDIKRQTGSWVDKFDLLEKSDKWIIGYGENGSWDIAAPPEISKHWDKLIGNGAYIAKPHTPLTEEWYSEMIYVLDGNLEKLKQFPSTFPQDRCELNHGKYPIGWNQMLGRIFHKLSFKYIDKLIIGLPKLNFGNYR